MTKSVPDRLKELGLLYLDRNAVYKDNYKHFGKIMMGLFPKGLSLTTEEEFNRFCIFVQMQSKLTRYAQQFLEGGHEDSLDDATVYTQLLAEYDDECIKKRKPALVRSSSPPPARND